MIGISQLKVYELCSSLGGHGYESLRVAFQFHVDALRM